MHRRARGLVAQRVDAVAAADDIGATLAFDDVVAVATTEDVDDVAADEDVVVAVLKVDAQQPQEFQ